VSQQSRPNVVQAKMYIAAESGANAPSGQSVKLRTASSRRMYLAFTEDALCDAKGRSEENGDGKKKG